MKKIVYKYLILLPVPLHIFNIFVTAHILASATTSPMYMVGKIFLPFCILCLSLTIVLFIKSCKQ
jgi:hypothetical protein